MSTPSEREAALRRALLRAAEQIEPAPGGLERIQVRLRRPRPALIAWLEAAWTALVMRAPDVIEAVSRRSAKVARLVWERFGPKQAPGPGPHRLSWIRPLAAMSVAVFVLGGGVYVALQSVSTISPTNGVAPGTPGGSGSHTGNGTPGNHGTTDVQGSQRSHSSAPRTPGPSPSCSPTTKRYTTGSSPSPGKTIDSSSPSPSTSPSTTPPDSPPPSPTTSPSVSPSGSTTPSSGGSASTPDTGTAGENPSSAGGKAVSASATETAALVSEATSASTSCHK